MESEWNNTFLGELVDVKQGLAINAKSKHLLVEDGMPLLRITDLLNDKQVQFINAEKAPAQCIANKEDLIYTRTGQVGYIFRGKVGVVHNNCFRIIPKNENTTRGYLYWFLSQNKIREYANTISSGSVQKDLNHTAFKSIPITIPSSTTQYKIEMILNSLEDKIELNNKMNQTLEKMAQTIFKEWFEEFNFPNAEGKPYKTNGGTMHPSELGEIPEGWEILTINKISKNKAKTHKFKKDETVIFINTGDILKGQFLHENLSIVGSLPGQAKKLIEKYDILFSEIRPKNKRFLYVFEDMPRHIVSTKFMVIKANEKVLSRYLYMLLTNEKVVKEINIIAESRSGTFPQITFDSIGLMPFIIPSLKYQEVFCQQLDNFDNMINKNNNETQTLTKLRDTLLPKLMSGEIEV